MKIFRNGNYLISIYILITLKSFIYAQEANIKCSDNSKSHNSVQSLINCQGLKEGIAVKVESYFEKKTPYDKLSEFVWKSNETKNDGCVYFKSKTSNGAWVRNFTLADVKNYILPMEFCGIENPPITSKQKYPDITNTLIRAFNHLKNIRSSILNIPKGDFYVNPSADDKKILLVPRGLKIQGFIDPSSKTYTSNIHWDETDIPVFNFIRSNNSGMQYLNFIFEGFLANHARYFWIDYLNLIGLDMGRLDDAKTMQTVIFIIDSNYLLFDNLNFSSSFNGQVSSKIKNTRNFSFGITAYGVNPGKKDENMAYKNLAKGNKFTNINLQDFVMGMLINGQEDCEISNIKASRRGDWLTEFPGPPGHVIYYSPGPIKSKNLDIHNIEESNNRSYLNPESPSFGTLAVKGVNGGKIYNIKSDYPMGVLGSGMDLQNVSFENIKWKYDENVCALIKRCIYPLVFHIITNKDQSLVNLSIKDVSLESPNQASGVRIRGDTTNNVQIKNFYLKAAQYAHDPKEWHSRYDFLLNNSNLSFFYIPTIPTEKYTKFFSSTIQRPVLVRSNSFNSKFYLTIKQYPGTVNFKDPNYSSKLEESSEETPLIGIEGSNQSFINVSF